MDPAANFSQRIRIERDNLAVGIVPLQGLHRYAVSRGIAKLWGNHRAVADIKIDIGGHKISLYDACGDGWALESHQPQGRRLPACHMSFVPPDGTDHGHRVWSVD